MIDSNIKSFSNPDERIFHLEDRGGNLLFLQRLLMLKDFKSNDRVLEIGCGTGILGYYFKCIKNVNIYGTEISKSAYNVAKHRINCIHVADGQIPNNLKDFDLIYCKDVLPMILDKQLFYKNIYNALSTPGIFCTYLPTYKDIINKPILKYIPESIERSIQSYSSIEENYKLLEEVGFSSLHTEEINLGTVNLDSNYCKKHKDGFFSNTDNVKNNLDRYSNLDYFNQNILELKSTGFNLYYNWIRTLIIGCKY